MWFIAVILCGVLWFGCAQHIRQQDNRPELIAFTVLMAIATVLVAIKVQGFYGFDVISRWIHLTKGF